MNELASQVSSVAQVIQLAVAPVFLLAGVGALVYGALLWFGSRQTAMEVVNLVMRRKAPSEADAA